MIGALLPILLLSPAPYATMPRTLDVTQFGARPDSGGDATIPFRQAITAARAVKGPVTLVVPPGRYDFFSTNAIQRRCYFSNATEAGSTAVRTIALDLSGLNGLTIEGAGAKLIMRGKMTMLVAEGCRNLSLRGLEFDFARPAVSEITATEKGEGYWVGRVHPDSLYRLAGNRIEWLGEDWHAFHNLTQPYDPITETTWRGEDPTEGASVREVGTRLLRFETGRSVVVGRTYQFRDTTRDQAGMWISRCRNVSMDDVKIRSMAGFGALFQFTENVDLHRVEVAPSHGRTCASAADILHFSGCRGKIRVADCLLTAAHDDAINVHGTHLRVVESEGARRIRVRFMHDQTWGFAAFAPGDEIEFVDKETLIPYAKAKVTEFAMTDDPRVQVLTLDRDLPKGLKMDSDVVENVTWTPSVEVTGCEIAKLPTRGILISTRRPVKIVNNRFFRIPMPSVLVADDAKSWYESGPARDLLVKGNRFFECGGPVVEIDPQIAHYAGAVHRNVRVEENEFIGGGHPLVSARAIDGLRVIGNRSTTQTDWVRSEHADRVQIERNSTGG